MRQERRLHIYHDGHRWTRAAALCEVWHTRRRRCGWLDCSGEVGKPGPASVPSVVWGGCRCCRVVFVCLCVSMEKEKSRLMAHKDQSLPLCCNVLIDSFISQLCARI